MTEKDSGDPVCAAEQSLGWPGFDFGFTGIEWESLSNFIDFKFSIRDESFFRIPYKHGFVGAPQSFEVFHGEWGPPVRTTTVIDWEAYCAWLIICDLLLTLAWLRIVNDIPRPLRLRHVSTTFRFSMGMIYGFLRMSLIFYLFRAKPKAIYQYIAVISFFLLSVSGLIGLLFQEGPFKNLRANSVQVYNWENPHNPFLAVTIHTKMVIRRLEYRVWGVIQVFAKSRRHVVTYLRKLLGFELAPAEPTLSDVFDLGLRKVSRLRNFAHSLLSDRERAMPSDLRKRSESGYRDGEKSRLLNISSIERPGEHISSIKSAFNDKIVHEKEKTKRAIVRSSSFERVDELPEPSRSSQSESDWSLEKFAESFSADEITLLGPGKVKIKVSKEKWNESLLYWAMPSLQEYFSAADGFESFSRPDFDMSKSQYKNGIRHEFFRRSRKRIGQRFRRKSGWTAFQDFVSISEGLYSESKRNADLCEEYSEKAEKWSPPIRGTVVMRKDGAIYSINPSFPNVREIVSILKKSSNASEQQVIIELVGREIICKSSTKVMFMFSTYHHFGIHLNLAQRKTLLWLMNTLNDMNPKEKDLRQFRTSNFAHPRNYRKM